MSDKPFSIYTRNAGRINGYGSRLSFKGDAEVPATCVFCGTETRMIHGKYAWHNCNGFICPAVDKTPQDAACIQLAADGAVTGENNDRVDPCL